MNNENYPSNSHEKCVCVRDFRWNENEQSEWNKKTENKWKQQNKYETLSSGRKRTSIESILVN